MKTFKREFEEDSKLVANVKKIAGVAGDREVSKAMSKVLNGVGVAVVRSGWAGRRTGGTMGEVGRTGGLAAAGKTFTCCTNLLKSFAGINRNDHMG